MNSPTDLPDPQIVKLRSLSFVVAFWTAVAIAVAMAGYAAVQLVLAPELTVRELVLRHLWHVLALGAVIHLACWLVFRYVLWKPLNGIYLHLYALGKGELDPLEIDTRIEELHTIAEGINLLIWRLSRERDAETLTEAQALLEQTTHLATTLTVTHSDSAERVLRNLNTLGESLQALAKTKTPQTLQA